MASRNPNFDYLCHGNQNFSHVCWNIFVLSVESRLLALLYLQNIFMS